MKCVHNSGKPAKKGYIRAIKLLNVKNTEIADRLDISVDELYEEYYSEYARIFEKYYFECRTL